MTTAMVLLPSGVVEVLQVPEEAGLFPRVVGRIFVQDAGHACRMCWERVRSYVGGGGGPRVSRTERSGRTRGTRALAACQRWSSASIFSRRRRRRPVHRYHRRRPLSKPRWICDGRAHPALLLARTLRRRRRRRRKQERRWRQQHHSPVSGARPVSCRPAAGPPAHYTDVRQSAKKTATRFVRYYGHTR